MYLGEHVSLEIKWLKIYETESLPVNHATETSATLPPRECDSLQTRQRKKSYYSLSRYKPSQSRPAKRKASALHRSYIGSIPSVRHGCSSFAAALCSMTSCARARTRSLSSPTGPIRPEGPISSSFAPLLSTLQWYVGLRPDNPLPKPLMPPSARALSRSSVLFWFLLLAPQQNARRRVSAYMRRK